MSNFLRSLDISGSGLTTQKYRLDIISQNIANAEVTRTESGGPYRRQAPVLKSVEEKITFHDVLEAAKNGVTINSAYNHGGSRSAGVKVDEVVADPRDFVPVYDPTHPDADERGYVMYPNVDITQEIIDAMDASRTYEANITAFNAVKQMLQQAMDMKI